MMFYQFFLNNQHNAHNNSIYTIIVSGVNFFTAPNVFHLPNLNLVVSTPPNIGGKDPSSLRCNNQFSSIYSWSNPVLFVKNVSLLFLYYFFLNNNDNSLSVIFTKLKKSNTTAIVTFFMNTVGYVLNIFFNTAFSEPVNLVSVNLNNVLGNWYQLGASSVVQLVWHSNLINQSIKGSTRHNYSTISLDSSHISLTYGSVHGIVDYRTNSLFLVSVREPNLENLNLLNLNVTSVYNWKIII